jgi:peptide/nickel transport system substrate-binding protein
MADKHERLPARGLSMLKLKLPAAPGASLASAIFATALLTALGSTAAPAAAEELRIGISQYPTTLHPSREASVAKSYVHAMTRRPMTVYDQQWELVCMLCTELPSIEAGTAVPEDLPDDVEGYGDGRGIALRYSIQPDAIWGDGTPVTTRDVMFTWRAGRHPTAGVGNLELYRRIYAVDVIDDKTFVLHADRISFQYSAINDFLLLPAHIEEPIFDRSPEEYRNRTAYDTDPTNPGLAFGPYRIVEAVPGSRLILERNETWWGKPPVFDRITILSIEQTTALEANLLSGNVDMIAGELGLTLDQALAFEKRHGDRYQVIYEPGLLYEHIDLMLENPILQDKRVRQALVYAIDRETISERLFEGRQPVAHNTVSPLDWVYNEEARQYPHNPAKAAELLDAAGWNECAAVSATTPPASPSQLEFMTTAGSRIRELVQQVLQSQWKQARDRHARAQRAGAGVLRPDIARAAVHRAGNVRLGQNHPSFGSNPDRGERLVGPELPRLPQRRDGRADRGDRRGTGSREAQGDVGPPAGDLCRGGAGDLALLARQPLYPAEMAAGSPPDRPDGLVLAVDRGLDRRRTLIGACSPISRGG